MAAITIQQAFALGLQHFQAGRLAEAAALFEQILRAQSDHADATHFLGLIAHQEGCHEVAVERISRAIALRPDEPSFHSNLAEVYRTMGRLEEAFGSLHRALELKPDYVNASINLGSVLRDYGRLNESITAYHRALDFDPENAVIHYNLGTVLKQQGQLPEAIAAYRRALEIQPLDAEAWNNLGTALAGNGKSDDAVAAFQRALEVRPDFALAFNNLADALCDRGQVREAVDTFRRALRLSPDRAWIYSNLIYTLEFHPDRDGHDITVEQQRWNRQFSDPAKQFFCPHVNDRNPDRPLRIGYVSPDFRDHVVGRNLRPLLMGHDSRDFKIVCYSGVTKPDWFTEEFQRHAQQWRQMAVFSDEALAELIRNDGVDILVDLTQHLAGNRLTVFARKPAPVQVSFAGYPATTGMDAIECRISDRWLEAAGPDGRWKMENGKSASAPCQEEVFLLDSFWCYDPCGIVVEVNSLPASQNGRVTFGSLNNFCKVNESALVLWARVLGRVKDSRLVLLSVPGSHRNRTTEFLEREGIKAHRVEFVAPRPRPRYFELYHGLDIVLDPFPYGGHTTSLDALWMGVPVVSLAGARPVSRAGLSILSNLGLPELVASSPDDYVTIASKLAHDLPRLAELRRTLRTRMLASVLMDATLFARNIETAYRTMWRRWVEGDEAAQRMIIR